MEDARIGRQEGSVHAPLTAEMDYVAMPAARYSRSGLVGTADGSDDVTAQRENGGTVQRVDDVPCRRKNT